jgi:hypothetical protein
LSRNKDNGKRWQPSISHKCKLTNIWFVELPNW